MGQRGPNAKPATARKPQATATPRRPVRGHEPLTRAQAVTAFLEGLWITSGALAGTRMVLRPWQREAVEAIYSEGAPIRTALLSMGRKGGKTAFAAGLALCALSGPEARRRGQILVGASDRPQAKLTYNEVRAFAMADGALAARLVFRDYNATIEDVINGSVFQALSSDAAKAHGRSGSFILADEVSQWKRGSGLMAALRTGMGAHQSPLLIALSTRSPDPLNEFEELLAYWEDVRAGRVTDPEFYGTVYSAPLDADPFSPEAWHAANPSMTPERLADIEAQARQAMRLPSQLPAFRAFVLNQPTATDDRWLDPVSWDACAGTAELTGPVYAGLDLSSGSADLTAIAMYAPETRGLRVWGFIPEARLAAAAHEDRAPYEQWAREGHVIVVPGKVIDREWLGHWLAGQVDGLELVTVTSDRWLLTDLIQQWDRAGLSLPLVPMGMGFKDQTGCVAAMESLVIAGRLRHGGNPLLRWSVSNVAIAMDPAANRKTDKLRSRGRIDPAVAALLAIGTAERQPAAVDFSFTGMVL